MFGELIPCGGGETLRLDRPVLVIGRSPDCDITVAARSVSSRHCELRLADGTWSIVDLNSKNGTQVNGARCEQRMLKPNDRLTIGKVRFRISYSPPESTSDARLPRRSEDDDLALEYLLDGDSESASETESKVSAVSRSTTKQSPKTVPAAQPRRYLGKLVPRGGGAPIPLLGSSLTIGRSSGCDIRIKQSTVSTRHCQLEYRDGYWFVTDLGSRNGTKVDGAVQDSACLMPDSILSVARFQYQIQYTPSGDSPPAESRDFKVSLLEKAGLGRAVEEEQMPRWMESDQDPEERPRYDLTPDADDPI